MTRTKFQQHLDDLGACSEARLWARRRTARQTWNQCERGDWLLWWYVRDKPDDRQGLVLAACACARLALKYVPKGEKRPLKAIQAAERWAKNPTQSNREAVYAAYAAAKAAYAATIGAYAEKKMHKDCCKAIRKLLKCPWTESTKRKPYVR